jgi:cobalt/nickel transport protein
MERRTYRWIGLFVALIIIFITPLTSSKPDGLNRVASDHGFAKAGRDSGIGVFPHYDVPGLNAYWDGVLSGCIGVAVVALILFLLTRMLSHAKKQ